MTLSNAANEIRGLEMGDLVGRLRSYATHFEADVAGEAAAALEAQDKRIRELESNFQIVEMQRDAYLMKGLAQDKRIRELEAAIAWANNSLFGSHGFFLSLNGGEPDEHHLDRAIEKLKGRIAELEAALRKSRKVLVDAIELGFIPSQHRDTAQRLADEALQVLDRN